MKVVICSIGRRNYLADWFREAFETEGIEGEILTTDADAQSAGATSGDRFFQAPKYEDPSYSQFMATILSDESPDLVFSVNDHEISQITALIDANQLSMPPFHFFTTSATQRTIEDKFLVAMALRKMDLNTPPTVLGSAYDAILHEGDRFVVKHRFGSGSSGVRCVGTPGVEAAIAEAIETAPSSLDHVTPYEDRRNLVVVQPLVSGQEFGVDGVFAIDTPGHHIATLARRKIRMRSGETDAAETIASAPFSRSLTTIGQNLGLRGFVDIDVIQAEDGGLYVIDINPRFGGGYPFMHIAGADVPRYYVQTIAGRRPDARLLDYDPGVIGAKYAAVRRVR